MSSFPLDTFYHFDLGFRMLQGEVPFTDIWMVSGVLINYIQAFFFYILGTNWTSYVFHASLINGLISRDRKNRTIFSLQSKGRDSETAFKKIDYFDPLSYVELYPKTGRTHQIRVHLKSISNPIICDESYGGGISRIKSYHVKHGNNLKMILSSINRVALHAYSIEFTHPRTNKKNKFFAPIPNDFEYILNILKKGNND